MIGFYVHHAGNGHLGRVRSIIAALGTEATVLSSLPAPADWGTGTAWVQLPRDDGDGAPRDPEAGGVLHWAPLGHAGLRERMGTIAAWVTRHRPFAFYVDVSVEVAAAVRLMGVPVVVAAMPGERVDRPHQLAYHLASRILAPWPEDVYRPDYLAPHLHKTSFVGGISRFADRPGSIGADRGTSRRAAGVASASSGPGPAGPPPGGPRRVLLLAGAGTTGTLSGQMRAVDEAATAAGWDVSMVGGPGTWSADHWQALREHDLVVTHAGQGAVADVATADRPALLLPQDRPFGEQAATAHALARAGMATVMTAGADWHDALHRAVAAPTAWHRWETHGAAARAAALIQQAAGEGS